MSSESSKPTEHWRLDALRGLLLGADEFALYWEGPCGGESILFGHDGRLWMFDRAVNQGWEQKHPSVAEDILGIGYGDDIGERPELRHREELPMGAAGMVSRTVDGDFRHVIDELDEVLSA